MMEKQDIVAALRSAMRAAMTERKTARADTQILAARFALKQFQSARIAATHADLLQSADSGAAALFFFNDLYGARDLTQRDADIERIVPMMERLLPLSALNTIMQAFMLDALSESLDAAMAAHLGAVFSEEDYADAYRMVFSRTDRERQIKHVQSVGNSLAELVRVPFIASTLSMMRAPAKLTGLSELHGFLEKGFHAFKAMREPEIFVSTIVERETLILDNLYAGRERPFSLR